MKWNPLWTRLADGVLAVLFAVVILAVAPGLLVGGAWLALAGVWVVLAWQMGMSCSLPVGLVVLAVRAAGPEVPAGWIAMSAVGAAAWALSSWRQTRETALVSSLMWGGCACVIPGVIPLVLFGFPRLSHMHRAHHPRWAVWPGLALLAAAWMWMGISEGVPEAAERVSQAGTYEAWWTAWAETAADFRFWTVLPLVGLFEVAQKQSDDHRATWRNLPIIGMWACVGFLTPETGFALLYINTFPLCSILLARWTLAIQSALVRGLFWAGLAVYALTFAFGGAV